MSREQIANWCRHYNGISGFVCRANVRYDDVKGAGRGMAAYPCFKDSNCAERCSSVSFLSEQEVDKENARQNAHAAAFIRELTEGKTCPHCHAPITELYQVGRCVYNRGCHCRQYQGVVPRDRRTAADQEQIDEASLWSPLEEEEAQS
jgi:hypothetical protein